jgi:hypothetical protein
MPDDLLICLPFAGFYESKWSDILDRECESFAEYFPEREEEQEQPEHLRLTDCEAGEALFWATDHSAGHASIARDYPEALDYALRDDLGFYLGLRWESMSSPREYNFETDRVFAFIPYRRALRLLARARADGYATLRKIIADRFTSRSGFFSGYSNDLAVWLAKPFAAWDHNEIGTLLLASADCEAAEWSAWETLSDHAWQYFEDAVNWAKFDEKVNAARDEKADQWAADNPGAELPEAPYRCRLTPDLFGGAFAT